MDAQAIFQAAEKSKLLGDPYVSKVWETVNDPSLFERSPDYLMELRKGLFRESLQFFARHSRHYAELFERLSIAPSDAELGDLAKLAVPSDILRGEGQKPLLIDDVEPGGEYFKSSGTSGKEPVKVYRSPLDLAVMIKANTDLFEYVYGRHLEEGKGVALFMAAPELRYRLSFVAFVQLALERKDIELIYGMDLLEGAENGVPWQKLEPNRDRILKFLKSGEEPKLFFTAPAGVYLMAKQFDEMGLFKKLGYRLASGAPPVRLGRGGLVVTGGGTKGFSDLPPYPDIVELSAKHFVAGGRNEARSPAPFMDVLGMTETLTALIDRYGAMDKVPHPLSEVFLLDPKTFKPVREEGKQGIVGIFNPFTTSWLEVFYPGDLMVAKRSSRYYGREFSFVRRLTTDEGWDLQRACGGSMEEMMRGK